MKILHTSDWHIGHKLYQKNRYDEHEKFLSWLISLINKEKIDVLLVSGDIFDRSNPGVKAQSIYFDFLNEVQGSACRDVIITAGNHDNPSFLEAHKNLLKRCSIHIVGSISDNPRDEVIPIYDALNNCELIVCAVPYLRDSDIRISLRSEENDDKLLRLEDAIREHYDSVLKYAQSTKGGKQVFTIVMGHFMSYNSGADDVVDGEKSIYFGSPININRIIGDHTVDYFALGHMHSPQSIGNNSYFRYSGSPIPVSISELKRKKTVTIIDLEQSSPSIQQLDIPVFQKILTISGDNDEIMHSVNSLDSIDKGSWIYIENTKDFMSKKYIDSLIELGDEKGVEFLAFKQNTNALKSIMHIDPKEIKLEAIDLVDMFDIKLKMEEERLKSFDKDKLRLLYKEILSEVKSENM